MIIKLAFSKAITEKCDHSCRQKQFLVYISHRFVAYAAMALLSVTVPQELVFLLLLRLLLLHWRNKSVVQRTLKGRLALQSSEWLLEVSDVILPLYFHFKSQNIRKWPCTMSKNKVKSCGYKHRQFSLPRETSLFLDLNLVRKNQTKIFKGQ